MSYFHRDVVEVLPFQANAEIKLCKNLTGSKKFVRQNF